MECLCLFMFITPSGVNTFFTSGSLFQVFRSLRQRQKDVSRKKKNTRGWGRGYFFLALFLCAALLEQATHLVVIVTTLETPKKIFCYNNNIMRNDNFKQDHLGQEHYEQPYKVFYRFLDVLNITHKTSLVLFYLRNYAAAIHGNHHDSSDCFEYPQKSVLKSSYPLKKHVKIFLPPKIPKS